MRTWLLILVLAVGTVLMKTIVPSLIPNVRRSRELQEDERSQDQWAKHLLEADASDAAQPTGGTIS